MLLRTSRLIAILFFAAMMLIAGVSANSDRQTQDARRKRQSKPARKLAQRNSRSSPKPTNQPLFQPVQDKGGEDGIEEVNGRDDWFLFQRKYPFDAIPDDARKRAYELRPAELLGPEVASWQLIGPTPTTSAFPSNWGVTSGRINSVAISPANSQIVLMGGATGGIWRSTNGGTSFSPTSDSQTDLAVQTIAFSASNSTIVYAGMGDTDGFYLGTGVLKSTDSGQTWTRINNSTLPSPGMSAKIEVDPTNSNRVYLAQYARLSGSGVFTSGFYLSTDGGVNWTKTLAGLPRDLVLNPANSQTLYLAMRSLDDGSLPGLYRSTNGGSTWARIYNSPYDSNATYDIAVAVTPANSQVIYVYTGGLLAGSFETRVEVSTNGGSTWTNRGSGILDRLQFGYNTYVYVDPTNANTVYVGTRDVFKSVNGGVSWTNLTNNFNTSGQYTPTLSNTHPDQHSFAFLPGSSGTFYIGNDGGIWKTTNSGTSFSNLNSSLSLTMFVGYAIHPTNAAISYGGTQDNGTQRRLSTPGQWQEFSAGDGGNCVVNVLNPSTVFSTYIQGSITRWTNNGVPPADATVGTNAIFGEPPYPDGRIAFYPPLTGNGVNSNLYFGTWRLFISTNLGNSWTAPAGTFDLTKGITANGPDVLAAIGVSRSNTNVIYTGSAQGRAMASTNGGASWTDITTGLPNRSITAITVDPGNSAKAYLTVSGFATSHVFSTINSGASWTNISGNLPDIPVNTLLIDPLNTNTLYVGTDIGVFQSTTGGSTWAGFNSGLPPVIVHRLVAQSSGLVQAATYGRGAFELTNGGTTTRTLTVASSNPSSGVSITVSPSDNNGQGNGVTQFTRTYNSNTGVALTAPSTAGVNNFQKWQLDGVDFTTSPLANLAMDANHTMTAFYTTPSSPSYQGSHDGAGCNTISGWAWDQNNPVGVVSVDIYDGNTLIATTPANMYREDLLNVLGSPLHGFSFPTPAALRNGAVHTIIVKFSGTSTILPNSSRTIQCSPAPVLQGALDGAGCTNISGWAWDTTDPNGTMNVDIYDGATLIGTIAATLYRQDLANVFGSPYHGFTFPTPASLKNGQPHTITAKYGGTNVTLTWNNPQTFTCSSGAPNFQGSHDVADCNTISGYAWDTNDAAGTVNVAIYADGGFLAVVPAQQLSPGIGNGYHGFAFAVPASLKNGQQHSILVRFSGTSTNLSNTPRSITCAGGGQQLLGNPGFESGNVVWSATAGVITNDSGQAAHAGTWKAWLDGYGATHTDTLSQTVAIPSAAVSASLTFWLHIDTAEAPGTPFDTLKVQVRNAAGTVVLATLATYSNLDSAAGFSLKSFDLTIFKGQTVTIYFEGIEDLSFATSFVIDDTALNVQ